jgi:glycine cleavage system H protein
MVYRWENVMKVDGYEVREGLYYSKFFGWLKIEGDKVRVGITDYAKKMLREIIRVELPSPGVLVKQNEIYGSVESVKAISNLIAPISGTVKEVNDEVISKPELVNKDPYGEGWLLIINPSNLQAELVNLMDFNQAAEWHKKLLKK